MDLHKLFSYFFFGFFYSHFMPVRGQWGLKWGWTIDSVGNFQDLKLFGHNQVKKGSRILWRPNMNDLIIENDSSNSGEDSESYRHRLVRKLNFQLSKNRRLDSQRKKANIMIEKLIIEKILQNTMNLNVRKNTSGTRGQEVHIHTYDKGNNLVKPINKKNLVERLGEQFLPDYDYPDTTETTGVRKTDSVSKIKQYINEGQQNKTEVVKMSEVGHTTKSSDIKMHTSLTEIEEAEYEKEETLKRSVGGLHIPTTEEPEIEEHVTTIQKTIQEAQELEDITTPTIKTATTLSQGNGEQEVEVEGTTTVKGITLVSGSDLHSLTESQVEVEETTTVKGITHVSGSDLQMPTDTEVEAEEKTNVKDITTQVSGSEQRTLTESEVEAEETTTVQQSTTKVSPAELQIESETEAEETTTILNVTKILISESRTQSTLEKQIGTTKSTVNIESTTTEREIKAEETTTKMLPTSTKSLIDAQNPTTKAHHYIEKETPTVLGGGSTRSKQPAMEIPIYTGNFSIKKKVNHSISAMKIPNNINGKKPPSNINEAVKGLIVTIPPPTSRVIKDEPTHQVYDKSTHEDGSPMTNEGVYTPKALGSNHPPVPAGEAVINVPGETDVISLPGESTGTSDKIENMRQLLDSKQPLSEGNTATHGTIRTSKPIHPLSKAGPENSGKDIPEFSGNVFETNANKPTMSTVQDISGKQVMSQNNNIVNKVQKPTTDMNNEKQEKYPPGKHLFVPKQLQKYGITHIQPLPRQDIKEDTERTKTDNTVVHSFNDNKLQQNQKSVPVQQNDINTKVTGVDVKRVPSDDIPTFSGAVVGGTLKRPTNNNERDSLGLVTSSLDNNQRHSELGLGKVASSLDSNHVHSENDVVNQQTSIYTKQHTSAFSVDLFDRLRPNNNRTLGANRGKLEITDAGNSSVMLPIPKGQAERDIRNKIQADETLTAGWVDSMRAKAVGLATEIDGAWKDINMTMIGGASRTCPVYTIKYQNDSVILDTVDNKCRTVITWHRRTKREQIRENTWFGANVYYRDRPYYVPLVTYVDLAQV